MKYLKVVGEWALVIGLAIGLSLLLRNFVMDVRVVPTGSMIPTIQEQDRVIVDRLFYRMGALRRGDVIVFTAPDKPELRDFSRQDLVKRLIGLPGETVEVNGGYVWVDGQALNEPYVNAGVTAGKYGPVQVPEGYCFVLGDNRGGSNDSRIWGCLEQRLIIGRVWIRHWPLDSLGPLTKPPDDYMIESAALGLCERWRPF